MKRGRGRPRKWKRCLTCNRSKLIETDYYHWLDGDKPRVAARCKECYRARVRERYAQVMADPYTRRKTLERQSAWALENKRRKNAERCRRYREKLKLERPEVYQQQLEDARIRNRLRNDRLGKPVAAKTAKVVEPFVAPLPVQPLVDFLNGVELTSKDIDPNVLRIAYRAMHTNRQYVTVLVADRLVTAYGGALSTVYPEFFA